LLYSSDVPNNSTLSRSFVKSLYDLRLSRDRAFVSFIRSPRCILGILAIRISQHPKGHPKATTIVALINAGLLFLVTGVVTVQALFRLTHHTPQIEALPVLIISAISAVVMGVGLLILGNTDSKEDVHMRSVILDTIADGASAGAVALTGAVIFFTHGLYWLDSAVALVIGLMIAYQAVKLLCEVIDQLGKQE
jgi:cobalt-zinc-cadmium efflux system protein